MRTEFTPAERRANALRKEAARIHEQHRKECTDQMKRCKVCREWKAHDAFHGDPRGLAGVKGTCKECANEKLRRQRYTLPVERLNEIDAKALKRGRMRRRRESAARFRDARFILMELYPHFNNFTLLAKNTGLYRMTLSDLYHRRSKGVDRKTYQKLKDFYADFMDSHLQLQ